MLFFEVGFGDVWYNQRVIDVDAFITCFQQLVCNFYKQSYRNKIDEFTRAPCYRIGKPGFDFCCDLEIVYVKSHKTAIISRPITSSHSLCPASGESTNQGQNLVSVVCAKGWTISIVLWLNSDHSQIWKKTNQVIPKFYCKISLIFKCVDLMRNNGKTWWESGKIRIYGSFHKTSNVMLIWWVFCHVYQGRSISEMSRWIWFI